MKLAFFETTEREEEIIRKRFGKHTLFFSPLPLQKTPLTSVQDADIVSVFIYSQATKKTLTSFKQLKLIATRSTGFDHIESAYCKKKEIAVCNVPTYGENTVAEHTFALILSLSRKIHQSYVRALAGDFTISGLKGFDLKGKTIGVVGTGHIGRNVIRIAQGFGMHVIAFDAYPNQKAAEEMAFKYVSQEELLKTSDIVTLHVPLIAETKHLINTRTLAYMKPTALLINTARGELIDTQALVKAIKAKKLGGAGLDVIEGEGAIKEEQQVFQAEKGKKKLSITHELIRNENVVYTPHIAFYSEEALGRILATTLDNIESFINKKSVNLV